MAKQLYYSEIHSKNIEIYLSKLYNAVALIMSRVQQAVLCDEAARSSTPAFWEEKGRY